jgi:DNA-directed RNA polymerase specialized sigma24 family protein
MNKQIRADITALRKIYGKYPMLKGITVLIMRYSGCTYQEIGDMLGTSRQNAERTVNDAKEKESAR